MTSDYFNGTNSHKIKRAHVSAASLSASDAVVNFPRQADMTTQRTRWLRPDGLPLFKPYEELPVSLSGHGTPQGASTFSWTWKGLTPRMVDYVLNTIWDGNATDDFTVETWTRLHGASSWKIYWVIGTVNLSEDNYEGGYRAGLLRLQTDFVVLQEAP